MFDYGHALVIGVGTYTYDPSLNVPVVAADAAALARVLSDPAVCGYPAERVTVLTDADATRERVRAALDALANSATEEAIVTLFLTGHGYYDEQRAYHLMTSDTRLTATGAVVSGSAISQAELLEALRRIRARRVLCLFNACHAGEITPTLQPGRAPFLGAPTPAATAAALLATGSGRVLITSCRDGQVAYVGNGAHTIFGQALLDGLRGNGIVSQQGFISVFDLYTHLYFAVNATLEQQVSAAFRAEHGPMEPELTILKGVGPFPVAAYRGASGTLGSFSAPPPAAGTAVREVFEDYSKAMLAQALHSSSAGRDVIQTGSITATDSQVAIGSGNVQVTGSTGVASGPGAQSTVATVTRGNDIEDLHRLVSQLQALLRQAPAGAEADAEAAVAMAQQAVTQATREKPNRTMVRISVDGLKQAAANLATVAPAILPLAERIAQAVQRLMTP
jgi:hypothetical protein